MATVGGCFDEESCRYFLREVGEKVVSSYGFDLGMEEAYSLILEKYGYYGLSDATSLLQDLLEDDDVAGGFGDDGDIWRAWRHHWKRRNANELNPNIPRIGRFILPLPTPRHIRKIKADNFLRLSENLKPSSPSPSPSSSQDDENQTSREGSAGEASIPDSAMQLLPLRYDPNQTSGSSTTRTTYSHQRCRLGLPHFDESIRDSQAATIFNRSRESQTASPRSIGEVQDEHVEVEASATEQVDRSHLLSLQKLCSGQNSTSKGKLPTDGTSQVCRPRHVEPSLPHSVADQDMWPHPLSPRSRISDPSALPDAKAADGPQKKIRQSRLSCSGVRLSEEDESYRNQSIPGQQAPRTDRSSRQARLSERSGSRGTPEPQRKAANRHASLVDGIFRSRETCVDVEVDHPVLEGQESKRLSQILSWKSWQPQSRRASLIQGVKSLFGATKGSTSNLLSKNRHTASIGHQHPAQRQLHKRNKSSASAAPSMPSRNLGLMLDGACDDQTSVSSTASYLNKPLPLTPDYIAKSLSSRTRSKSYSQASSLPQGPPTASTTSTKVSNVSSKAKFQVLANDLVQPHSMKPFELSPVREVDARYQRQRANDSQENAAPASPMSFTTISQQNPFLHDYALQIPAISTINTLRQQTSNENRFSFGLPASRSEPNLSCRISGPPPPVPMFFNPQGLPQSPPSSSPEAPESKKQKTRGRAHTRNQFDKEEETEEMQTPREPAKRSRSPVKRILGLGKTTPKPRAQTPTSSPEKLDHPSSSTKRSFKQWTNKFRHGFLTADQEEARRETQMEKYMDKESKASPQSGALSTFPISLDPAHQARVQADMELMIVVSANRFLLKEAAAGRLAPSTISAVRREWEKQNLPQVLEYLYDQGVQRELIVANLQTLKFCGSAGQNAMELSSTLYSWGVLAREMKIRTFCAGDSVIKKWLNDARRVLELLGAPLITFLAFQDLELKTQTRIVQRQHQRAERTLGNDETRNASGSSQAGLLPRRDWSATSNYGLTHRRNMSDGSRKYNDLPAGLEHLNLSPTASPRYSNSEKSRKPTFVSGVPKHGHSSSTGDVCENSRGSRLGYMTQIAQPSAPHEHVRLHYATTPTRTPPMPPIPTLTPTPASTSRRRPGVDGEVILKRGLWSDRQ